MLVIDIEFSFVIFFGDLFWIGTQLHVFIVFLDLDDGCWFPLPRYFGNGWVFGHFGLHVVDLSGERGILHNDFVLVIILKVNKWQC